MVVPGELNEVGVMTYNVLGPAALEYLPCQYGSSRLTFRGPKRQLDVPYIVFLGGNQTYGKFIEKPFPLRVEHQTGITSVNLGQPNAGLDVFAGDVTVAEMSRQARVCVIEVLGAANMSNRFYKVHPRRNDRFLGAAPQLRHLYPDVDFTAFHFTGHMLQHLYHLDAERFAVVRRTLQRVWVQRMRRLCKKLGGKVVLLWMARDTVPDQWAGGPGEGPAFVCRDMLEALTEVAYVTVEAPWSTQARAQGTSGMVFTPFEKGAASLLAGPEAHCDAAEVLRPVLDDLV